LNKIHFSHVWDNQITFSNKRLFHAIYEKLTEFIFFVARSVIFFPKFNIRLYDKNSESDYFFSLHQNQNIFFSNIRNQNIFLEKKHNPPPPPPFKWHVSCLLYADDLVLISESAIGLQNSLNILSCYCDKWNLTVNLDKAKIKIFNKAGRKLTRESFLYKNFHQNESQDHLYILRKVWAQDATLFNPYFRLEKVSYAILWSNCKQYFFVHVLYTIKKGPFILYWERLMERNVSCLLYADDLVLISESAIGFQNSLNILSCYCDKWNLTVNLDKTKSMI
jgi:hypothetical protein